MRIMRDMKPKVFGNSEEYKYVVIFLNYMHAENESYTMSYLRVGGPS